MDIKEPKAIGCPHCDFSSGQRGMDRCGKCDGTGSVFRIGLRLYPNTDQGYEAARKALNPERPSVTGAALAVIASPYRRGTFPNYLFSDRVRLTLDRFEALPIADRARGYNPCRANARMLLPDATGRLRYHMVTGNALPVYTPAGIVNKQVAREIVIRVPSRVHAWPTEIISVTDHACVTQ